MLRLVWAVRLFCSGESVTGLGNREEKKSPRERPTKNVREATRRIRFICNLLRENVKPGGDTG